MEMGKKKAGRDSRGAPEYACDCETAASSSTIKITRGGKQKTLEKRKRRKKKEILF